MFHSTILGSLSQRNNSALQDPLLQRIAAGGRCYLRVF
jgi:hypothetical protein